MKKNFSLLLVGIMAAAPATAFAQRPGVIDPPKTWASVYGLMYTSISSLRDPDSASRWLFDDNAFGFGATLHRQMGQSLMLGIDASYARPRYERRELESDVLLGEGTAAIATALATGRYGYTGGGDIGFYLAGGVGTIAYNLEDLDGWNTDLALQAGTGLEYRFAPNRAVALEWGRTWGYHEKESLGGGNQTHSALKLSVRLGF
jgi:opacity protein-like surface antigen